jgi:hypothetical protein
MMNPSKAFESAKTNKEYLVTAEKATWAYHWDRNDHPHAHTFLTGKILRNELFDHVTGKQELSPKRMFEEQCTVCWRTRYEIRNDSLAGHCIPMESLKPIEEVILAEEDKFLSLLNSAENRIPQLLAEKFNGVLDAEALFYLQSTSGFPPDVVALHYDEREIERLMPEFDTLMQSHKGKSGNFRKK